ncbi:MAG: SUMF1/EgtB/PvdO family nonheme iron enzyme [Polyangiaceae bacterium]|nr:SUMF1/EgtB/PvdO family nonheme iron enzyme [Polyangiaceae bacterium]
MPGTSEGCPSDMVLVAGDYCPTVQQKCIEHHSEFNTDQKRKKKAGGNQASTVSERCMRYEEPSVCLSKKRVPMRFCMDRYEWPNQKGELPALLVSWGDAKKLCEEKGKRLCMEAEYNFACEGEAMLPYTYGYERDATACNIDREYRKREKSLKKYERCMKKPGMQGGARAMDQRFADGLDASLCISVWRVRLNGNINEWVERPKQKYPNRSGLKGGWWGPVRGRCRPTVGFHKEDDYGYEEGFRCCKDAEGQ